jgi:hypothetical protein
MKHAKHGPTFLEFVLEYVESLFLKYRVRHKSVNTPLFHEWLVVRTWLAVYSGWG